MNGNLRGRLEKNASLKMLNSWHVGGLAQTLYHPADLQDFIEFMKSLDPNEPVTVLGLGSNVLIRDAGISGTVIVLHTSLMKMDVVAPQQIRVEAGVPCAKLAKFVRKQALMGGEFFAGIPGTVGGALAMNAGAFGGETWEHVIALEWLDRQGNYHKLSPADFKVGYRSVHPPFPGWFTAATFEFQPGESDDVDQKIKQLLKRRSETQPIGLPSCGSVFCNPEGDHSARLIEACGLKGLQRGGAQISPKHANFIVNTGSASSEDIEYLIQHIYETVLKETGIALKCEVRFLGKG